MLVSFVYLVAWRLFALVLLLARSDCSKDLELLVLRHELSILRRQARRTQRTESDRLLLAALSRVLPRRSWQAFLVTPETLLRWHRRIVACRWTYPRRRPGRPPVDQKVRELILRLARENSHWGYVRIVGELRKLGVTRVGDAGAQPARLRRHLAGTQACRVQLAVVPAPTRTHDPRL
jgi:putative transposase